jgi:hypothetical protein
MSGDNREPTRVGTRKLFGDRVDRILSHRISTDRKILLNSRRAKESFTEIRKYNNNISRNLDNATTDNLSF